MKIKIHYLLWTLIFVVIIIVGVIFFVIEEVASEPIDETPSVNYQKLDEIIFDVKTSKAFIGDLIKSTNANGVVRAAREIDVTSNINSRVEQINIYEGKKVKKGDLLIKLDDREYNLNLKEAEDKLIEARVEYYFLTRNIPADTTKDYAAQLIQREIDKLDIKKGNGLINETEYKNIRDSLDLQLIFVGGRKEDMILNRSGINRAKTQKEKALLNIEYTNITAPFDGVIGNFDLSIGQRITSGEILFKLIDNTELLIDVGILESEIPFIEKGNKVDIEFNALPGEKFNGYVALVSPFIDEESRTCKVTILLEKPSVKIKPGMFASVKIQMAVLKNRLLVPKDALLIRDRRNLVFTVEDSLAKWKYIDLGEQNDEFIEIKNGIYAGDEVIIQGHYTLAHDAKVRVIE